VEAVNRAAARIAILPKGLRCDNAGSERVVVARDSVLTFGHSRTRANREVLIRQVMLGMDEQLLLLRCILFPEPSYAALGAPLLTECRKRIYAKR
jgi:hypothetical protein